MNIGAECRVNPITHQHHAISPLRNTRRNRRSHRRRRRRYPICQEAGAARDVFAVVGSGGGAANVISSFFLRSFLPDPFVADLI